MESLVSLFENIPPLYRAIILVTGMAALWMIEDARPLFPNSYGRGKHAALNLVYTLTTLLVNLYLAFLLIRASEWASEANLGLLHLVELPMWARVTVGILLLDLFGAYLIHYLEHRFKWLWRFHLVHHTDQHIDVTSGLRHHPGESVFRAIFTAFAIVVSGSSIGILFLYQTLSAIFAQITHANIEVPRRFDRALSCVFVTPLMHKVHHHYKQPLTDSNYGNVFALWDRLFGTFMQVEDTRSLVYGIDTHMDAGEHESVAGLFMIPFRKYRATADSKFPTDPVEDPSLRR